MKKSLLLYLFILLLSPYRVIGQPPVVFPAIDSEPLNHTPNDALILHDHWEMRESVYVEHDGSIVSTPGFHTNGWYATTVPTTALGTLVRNGIYPDPYIGINNMKIPDASDEVNEKYDLNKFSHLPDHQNPWVKPYWFRNQFKVPASFKGETVTLNFDGINYRADIWLNGELVADSDSVAGMFRRFYFDVSDLIIHGGNNVLAVCIYPLDYPGNQFRVPLDGPDGSLGTPGGDGEILRNVTQYCSIGWDWVPSVRDRNMGIWQHVSLRATGAIRVQDPAAFTEVSFTESNEARVTVRCMVENFSDTDKKMGVNVIIAPLNFTGEKINFYTTYNIPARAKEEMILTPEEFPSLIIPDPQLWWPVNYGEQSLYRLTVEVTDDGIISDRAYSNFGIRTIDTCVLPSGGRAIKINGRQIRLTGGAWVPDFLMSWSAQRYRDEVRLMAEGNHTIVRINGCGIIVPDAFMDECDKRGLLVWQELSRTSVEAGSKKESNKTWTPPYVDPDIYLENMKDCIIRLRSHPSLIIWCGSNEAAPQSDIGIALQNEIIPALDDSRIWLPSSAETPDWSNIEVGGWTGGPWDIKPINQYYKFYQEDSEFAFKNEIGLASPPNINTIAQTIPGYDQHAEWFPINKELSYHDAAGFTIRALNDLISENLGQATSLNEYLWMGNLYNNIAYRTIFEAANKARPLNPGTMLWKTNAAWPSFNWQIFDWFLRQNAGYYSMRSACKPIHIQASPDDMTVQVASILTEDKPDMKVRITIISTEGETEAVEERRISVKADAVTVVGALPDIVNDGKLHFVAMDLSDDSGNTVDRTVVWLQKEGVWHDLLKLRQAKITVDVISINVVEDELQYTFTVNNMSEYPAVNVVLGMLEYEQGREILPSFWSDNEMTMIPYESREVSVRFRKGLIADKIPNLNIEGWNVLPSEISLQENAEMDFTMAVEDFSVISEDNKTTISFTAFQASPQGVRINNWPVPLYVNGQFYRNVLLGLNSNKKSSAVVNIDDLPEGVHLIKIGNCFETKIEVFARKHHDH